MKRMDKAKNEKKELIVTMLVAFIGIFSIISILWYVSRIQEVDIDEPIAIPQGKAIYIGDPMIKDGITTTPTNVKEAMLETNHKDVKVYGQLVKINLTFQADRNGEPALITDSDFTIIANGKEIKPFYQQKSQDSAFSAIISKDRPQTGSIYFDVPDNAEKFYLRMYAKPYGYSTTEALWTINKSDIKPNTDIY